ncbi:MAG: AbrB/MazE/SpoVT family DNA-binding domain-containing protein [Candidatus Asgardarchaeia archaeon]
MSTSGLKSSLEKDRSKKENVKGNLKSNVLSVNKRNELVIPPEIVKKMNWKINDSITYFIEDDELILAKTISFKEAREKILRQLEES